MSEDRDERTAAYVLMAVADDWEDLTMICREVGRHAANAGISISIAAVLHNLSTLIDRGLVRTGLLSTTAPNREIRLLPQSITYGSDWAYFYITEEGKTALHAFPEDWFYSE